MVVGACAPRGGQRFVLSRSSLAVGVLDKRIVEMMRTSGLKQLTAETFFGYAQTIGRDRAPSRRDPLGASFSDTSPSRFTLGSTHYCGGSGADGRAYQDQTGWPGFCNRDVLSPVPGYAFQATARYWKTAFDAHWADARAFDGFAQATIRARSSEPCNQGPYYLQPVFKGLLKMYRATGEIAYVEEAVHLADLMIRAAVPYNPAWARPSDRALFDAWVTRQGQLLYWNADSCAPTGVKGYRYQLDELQGLRGISELARVLKAAGDARWSKYFHYADQVVSFYAMLGNGNPNLDSSGDKRGHFIMNALDLFAASGETRFRDWATVVANTQVSVVYKDLGNYIEIHNGTGRYSAAILDVSHANRDAELVSYWDEIAWQRTADYTRKMVNTLLFRIWENDPQKKIGASPDYPTLFRNFTDGSNQCANGTNPPYRLGNVVLGWNELSRYDRRVLHIIETLTMRLVERTVIVRFPAAGPRCTPNGNTNYSFVGLAIAEMAYVQKLFGQT